MTLLVRSTLSVELITVTLTELFRIFEISIFILDNCLRYVINIPLVSNAEYNVYHPNHFNLDTLALIDTKIDYLAVSSYFTQSKPVRFRFFETFQYRDIRSR